MKNTQLHLTCEEFERWMQQYTNNRVKYVAETNDGKILTFESNKYFDNINELPRRWRRKGIAACTRHHSFDNNIICSSDLK